MTQGAHIKALLRGQGWSLARLARETGIDRSALTNIANDRIGLGPDRGQRIADALGLPLAEVLLEVPTPREDEERLARIERQLAEILEILDGDRRRSA